MSGRNNLRKDISEIFGHDNDRISGVKIQDEATAIILRILRQNRSFNLFGLNSPWLATRDFWVRVFDTPLLAAG